MCEDLRYGQCRVLSSSFVCCDFSSTPCASTFSIGSLPLTDSDWFVRVGSDNARISCRISASRSGGLGGVLIYVRDATDLNFCLVLRSFCCRRRESRLFARVKALQAHPECRRNTNKKQQYESRAATSMPANRNVGKTSGARHARLQKT